MLRDDQRMSGVTRDPRTLRIHDVERSEAFAYPADHPVWEYPDVRFSAAFAVPLADDYMDLAVRDQEGAIVDRLPSFQLPRRRRFHGRLL